MPHHEELDSSAVFTRLAHRYLKEKFKRLDLVVVDLDQCIFPGYSQTYLAALVTTKLLLSPEKQSDRLLLPSLLSGCLFVFSYKVRESFGVTTCNKTLIDRYEKTMQGVPESYFRWAARKIPSRSFPGSLETLELLAQKAVLGIVSLGIDCIVEAYQQHTHSDRGNTISFYDSNALLFRASSGRRVLQSYCQRSMIWNGYQKEEILKKRVHMFKATCPLVIGHKEDERAMMDYVCKNGGISIGFNPERSLAASCDIIVRGASWYPLLDFIRELIV